MTPEKAGENASSEARGPRDVWDRREFLGRTSALVASTVLAAGSRPALGATAPAIQTKTAVLVNQLGYDAGQEKILLVQIAGGLPQLSAPEFHLVDDKGRIVFTGNLNARGRVNAGTAGDWGANYWTGEFSAFCAEGVYHAKVLAGAAECSSFPFRIGAHALFAEAFAPAVQFFRLQRCGCAVPGLHPPCHLDDAKIPAAMGGGHLDATGGWHDAGDFNKYTSLASRSAYALMVLARESSRKGWPEASRQNLLDEGLWGSEWLRKMWQPGKGIVYEDVWSGYGYFRGTPDKETDNRIGTADDRPFRGQAPSAMVAAALAAAARATGRSDFREAAEDLWRGAVKTGSNYPEDAWVATCNGVPDLGEDTKGRMVRRTAQLLLADLELEALTAELCYRDDARSCVEFFLHEQKPTGLWPSDFLSRIVFEGEPAAALALYVEAHPQDNLAPRVRESLSRWLEKQLSRTANPFGLLQWSERDILNPYVGKTWYCGQNGQYLSNAWAMALLAKLLAEPRGRLAAAHQLDWVMGRNPYNLCLLQGTGTSNPPQLFPGWTPERGRNLVTGGIAPGFVRPKAREDRPSFDLREPPQEVDWHTNEPWEPYNAYLLLTLTALHSDARA